MLKIKKMQMQTGKPIHIRFSCISLLFRFSWNVCRYIIKIPARIAFVIACGQRNF